MLSLSNALERYAFSYAAKFIHLIDPDEQLQLIRLISQLDTMCPVNNGLVQLNHDLAEQVSGSCLSELQQEWKEALNKPS